MSNFYKLVLTFNKNLEIPSKHEGVNIYTNFCNFIWNQIYVFSIYLKNQEKWRKNRINLLLQIFPQGFGYSTNLNHSFHWSYITLEISSLHQLSLWPIFSASMLSSWRSAALSMFMWRETWRSSGTLRTSSWRSMTSARATSAGRSSQAAPTWQTWGHGEMANIKYIHH